MYYEGTAEQWNDIIISGENACLINATYYYFSENKPTTDGNGVVIEW